MSKIKLFMCCHKQYETLPPLCEAIQCGSALNSKIENTVHDDFGENISLKNHEYCELTAHYYAWKNVNADYYGFCHYRRFFAVENCIKRPYTAKFTLSEKERNFYLGNEEYWQNLIENYEILTPRSEDMGLSVREHYCGSKNHYSEDLNLFLEILFKKAPWLIETAKIYLSQSRQYFCNMFIMKKTYFFEYCEIMFSVLDEFDSRKTLHGNFCSDRTDGYLGEIFTGIYIAYCYKKGIKIKELPRIDIGVSNKKRICYILFPPESKRRFFVKKVVKAIRGKQNV